MTSVQISERDLQNAIVDAAHLYGYLVFHTRPALSKKGWRTAVSYDGKGFVDLVLVGPERIVFAEIKSAKGKLSREQEHWLEGLAKVAAVTDRVRVCVWTPADWPERVMAALKPRIRTHDPTTYCAGYCRGVRGTCSAGTDESLGNVGALT